MLTCVARSKQSSDESPVTHKSEKPDADAAPDKQMIKTLSFQVRSMALKASGAYRHCAPCAGEKEAQLRRDTSFLSSGSDLLTSDKFQWPYRRTESYDSSTTAGRRELEARLKGISSGEGTPVSASRRRVDTVVFVEESEPKEWVAQVELGVLITFVSLPPGGNDLKQIRFSRETFNKWQAQRWWTENCEKVMELYNVPRLNREAFPLPTTPRSEDDASSKIESFEERPLTPPLGREPLSRTFFRPTGGGMARSSSDSLDHQSKHSNSNYDACDAASTPKISSISGAKTVMSSADASIRTCSSRDVDRSGEISISNASDLESEWVEQDEQGVYITIRELPDGKRELRRVRFSYWQPREIWGGGCKIVVGREQSKDTQAVPVIQLNKASRSDAAFLANNDYRFLVIKSEGQFSTHKRESSLYNENSQFMTPLKNLNDF